MTVCRDCGEELDDFAPCACAIDRPTSPYGPGRPRKGEVRPSAFNGGMRSMVARKLAKERGDETP